MQHPLPARLRHGLEAPSLSAGIGRFARDANPDDPAAARIVEW